MMMSAAAAAETSLGILNLHSVAGPLVAQPNVRVHAIVLARDASPHSRVPSHPRCYRDAAPMNARSRPERLGAGEAGMGALRCRHHRRDARVLVAGDPTGREHFP